MLKSTKTSPDTALRDINDLLARGVLVKGDASSRSTSYALAPLGGGSDLVGKSRSAPGAALEEAP